MKYLMRHTKNQVFSIWFISLTSIQDSGHAHVHFANNLAAKCSTKLLGLVFVSLLIHRCVGMLHFTLHLWEHPLPPPLKARGAYSQSQAALLFKEWHLPNWGTGKFLSSSSSSWSSITPFDDIWTTEKGCNKTLHILSSRLKSVERVMKSIVLHQHINWRYVEHEETFTH